MSMADQVAQLLKTEKDRKAVDCQFARAIETIDNLKKEGILTPTKYRLPLNDTVGRHAARESTKAVDSTSA